MTSFEKFSHNHSRACSVTLYANVKEKNPYCGVCIMIILIQWAQLLAVRISLLLNTTLHLGMQ